ncbi:MAG: hypothetical protein RQ761_04450 [Bacteroidales bacterium]|nr:hypothetical protein [Bacteroidales bacterium]
MIIIVLPARVDLSSDPRQQNRPPLRGQEHFLLRDPSTSSGQVIRRIVDFVQPEPLNQPALGEVEMFGINSAELGEAKLILRAISYIV